MIVESPLIQELLHEWTEAARREAAEQALQQGLQQGRVEGEIEAAIHIARRIAESRFGLLPPELEQRLRAMPHNEREAAIARLATVASLAEWLQSPP